MSFRLPRLDGPFKCRFCPSTLENKSSHQAQAWEWITGYLPSTEHCCPICLKTNGAMWREIVRRSATRAAAQGEKA